VKFYHHKNGKRHIPFCKSYIHSMFTIITLWLFKIAMENHIFFIGKPSINGPSIAWQSVK
jgi:hypothetical protein